MYRMVRGAHEGPVFSILVQKDGSITTGGKDGNIVEWDRDLERTGNVIQVSCAIYWHSTISGLNSDIFTSHEIKLSLYT